MLPLTCVVYWEAPITVARIPSLLRSSFAPNLGTRARISCAKAATQIAIALRFAPVDVFRDTPPENVIWSMLAERARGSSRRSAAAADGGRPPAAASNSRSAMQGGQRCGLPRARAVARLRDRAPARRRNGGRPPPGGRSALRIEADKARAHIKRRDIAHACRRSRSRSSRCRRRHRCSSRSPCRGWSAPQRPSRARP